MHCQSKALALSDNLHHGSILASLSSLANSLFFCFQGALFALERPSRSSKLGHCRLCVSGTTSSSAKLSLSAGRP